MDTSTEPVKLGQMASDESRSRPRVLRPWPPRSRTTRLVVGVGMVLAVGALLAVGVLRILGPSERFGTLALPYVQEFTDVNPKEWFLSRGIWSIRDDMLAQVANLTKPASIYVPGQMAAEHPYHLSTYIILAKTTQAAGINFNAQYPNMTEKQHQVYVARRPADVSTSGPSTAAMELVAGYTDENGDFLPQVTVPFDSDPGEYRLDLYVLGNTYTVQLNGQTLIDRRPLFFPNGLVGYYTLGPAKFDTLKITVAETREPGEQVYTSDFDQQPGGAGWVPFSGEWEITDRELVQANPVALDAGIGYEGSAFEDYVVQTTFRHLTGVGGGLLFNMVSPYQLNDAHVVRFSDQTDSIFWGHFDNEGVFVRQGFADVGPPGSDPQLLRVFVGALSYDVYWNDEMLAREVPIWEPHGEVATGRSGGHIGLVTSRSSVAFELVEVFPLVGKVPLERVRPGATATTLGAPAAPTPIPPMQTGTSIQATPTLVRQPITTPLPQNSSIIRQGREAAWRGEFRGNLRDSGWRPLAGQWRFRNDSLSQEDTTGFDLAIAYVQSAFHDYSYTASFSHRDGNGAGILFNMPYSDRLNGAHMVRYSDRRPGGIFWGYYDNSGRFVGQGYANVAPPGDTRHSLQVVSEVSTYSVFLDGFLLANDLPLQQNYGYVGLLTVLSSADFDGAQVDASDSVPTTGQTPAAIQPLAPAGIYSGTLGFPNQRVVSGKWEIDQGTYSQTVPDVADYILNTGLYAADYSIHGDVFLVDRPGIGGGFALHMPERSRKAGATVVRFINGGQGLFWGVYDEAGVFRGRESVELPPRGEGETGYRLAGTVRGNRLDVSVNGLPVIEGAILPRTEGWIGLVAFGGPVVFGNVEVAVTEEPVTP